MQQYLACADCEACCTDSSRIISVDPRSTSISFQLFNTVEGCIWLAMGVVFFILSRRLHRQYAKPSIVAGIVLVLFGLSDFCEVWFGSFLQPGMIWLFVWKIVGVAGLASIILWYVLLRMRRVDGKSAD